MADSGVPRLAERLQWLWKARRRGGHPAGPLAKMAAWRVCRGVMCHDTGGAMAEKRSSWAVGWTAFAMAIMFMVALMWIFIGLVGVAANEFFVTTPKYLIHIDATTWGWIHFFVGMVVMFASYALFIGAVWARTIGVIIAIMSALTAFAWLPTYPVWAVLIIAACMSVIWALTAHGRDIATPK
jgi:hypothetical protein